MKIIIVALGANMGGAMRHLSNFIPVLLEKNNGNEYVLLVRDDINIKLQHSSLKVVRIPSKTASNYFQRTLFDICYIPYYAFKIKADVIVSLLNFGPVFKTVPHINFQRNALFFYNDYVENLKGMEKFYTRLRAILLYLTMRFADIVVTPSDSMREQIIKKYPSLKRKKFYTLYHGFSLEENGKDDKYWSPLVQKDKRFKLLYPTHFTVYKGFDILFEALALLKKYSGNFVLYTTIDQDDLPGVYGQYISRIEKLKIGENVIITGRLPQNNIHSLYKNCDLMIYSSLCESFGFPMVEAIGYCIPIVAADTEINKEICGEAAIYYSQKDPEDLAQKLYSTFDSKVRESLKAKAINRKTEFDWSWQRYADEFSRLCERTKQKSL